MTHDEDRRCCDYCGKPLRDDRRATARYCDKRCKHAAWRERSGLAPCSPFGRPVVAPPIEEDHGFSSPCLIYQGYIDAGGHGAERRYGVYLGAHRWAFIDAFGAIPPDCEVHHRCRVPSCVNPNHLEPLTPKEHGELHAMDRRAALT